jgi:hypothetical protein
MAASFQEITLDTGDAEHRGVMILRDGRLTAILTHLSAMHEEMAGLWFLEALFARPPARPRHTFADPDDFIAWLDTERA